ncbi:MAG: galactokinase, partial [Bacteroidales bacterium]|nr:galactokinase [Bacteroidales bacterium]
LTDSKYNERRSECEKAVEMLQPFKKIDSLTDIRFEEIELLGNYIDNETIFRRARHVISENARVRQAVEALKKGDLLLFGNLMNQSHDSLKNDYEVTGHELDTLVNESRKVEGVIGSRMTGAGFGGCTVSLVESVRIEEFIRKVKDGYTSITGLTPDFYMPGIGTGASRIAQTN